MRRSKVKTRIVYIIRKVCFGLFAKSTIKEAQKIIKALNYECWLDFGTLLGVIREGDFIKNDFDIDLGVYGADPSVIEEKFKVFGFKLADKIISDDGHFTLGFIRKGVLLDVYGYVAGSNSNVECIIKKDQAFLILESRYSGTKTVTVFENKIEIPKFEKEWLTMIYGPGYIAPDDNYTGSLNIKCEISHEKVLHTYIEKLIAF
jgi:hypothetical protein